MKRLKNLQLFTVNDDIQSRELSTGVHASNRSLFADKLSPFGTVHGTRTSRCLL